MASFFEFLNEFGEADTVIKACVLEAKDFVVDAHSALKFSDSIARRFECHVKVVAASYAVDRVAQLALAPSIEVIDRSRKAFEDLAVLFEQRFLIFLGSIRVHDHD